MDKVYLCKRGDEGNLIEVDGNTIKVVFDGKREWFNKHQIDHVRLKDIHEASAIFAGIFLGGLGVLMSGTNLPMGLVMLVAGFVVFHFGMQWHRRLLICLDSRMVYSLTFFHHSVHDIQAVLAKYGYLERSGFRWPF